MLNDTSLGPPKEEKDDKSSERRSILGGVLILERVRQGEETGLINDSIDSG